MTTGKLLETMFDSDTMYHCSITIHGNSISNINLLDQNAQEALAALAKIQYNEFDGKKVSKFLAGLLAKGADVQIGREYSPVVYVTMPRLAPTKGDRDKALAMAQAVMAEGKRLHADEFSVERRTRLPEDAQDFSKIVARLWWD